MQLPGPPTLLRLKATTRWNTLKLAYDAIHQANSPVVESPPLPPRAARKHDRQGRLRVGDLINYGTIARLLEPNNFNAAIKDNTLDHFKLVTVCAHWAGCRVGVSSPITAKQVEYRWEIATTKRQSKQWRRPMLAVLPDLKEQRRDPKTTQ
ncbi:hypothetical protein B0O99DRAFT_684229 [Bisporella sp. PMI_857]|nr:hypothetical protein B0O99DRAFT_684229 [Bisporella sp. PMI_857]